MLTLELIVAGFQEGTLATQPTPVLQDAVAKVTRIRNYQIKNPEFTAELIPGPVELEPLVNFLEKTLETRFGTDGMTPVSP